MPSCIGHGGSPQKRTSLLEPSLLSTHAYFCAVVEIEFHLIHELPHEEYASSVIAAENLLSNRSWLLVARASEMEI
jgi:hypothetical protein